MDIVENIFREFRRKETWVLASAFLVSLPLFYIFYALFRLFYGPIHNAYPVTDPNTIIWWQQLYIFRDGLESRVMFIGSIIYLGLSYLFFERVKKIPKLNNFLKLLLVLPLLIIIISTRSDVFSFAPVGGIITILGIGFLIYFCFNLTNTNIYMKQPILFQIIAGILFVALVIFGQDLPDLVGYNFFVGPALKLLQGEHLGSFNMQYSLLGTLLFSAMMKFGLNINQMQLVLAFTFIFWFWLWWLLAVKLIGNGKLRFLFIVALILVRYLALVHDPMQLPQVLPFRLDLWVILTLVVLRFGFVSVLTSLAFCVIYIIDYNFGLFYFGVYVISLLVIFAREMFLRRDFKLNSKEVLNLTKLILPLLVAPLFNLYFFKSLINPGAIWFEKYSLLFAPIDKASPFWLMFSLLPVSLFILSKEKIDAVRRIYYLILGFFLVELIYFYGRSVDHNLLNISGIWVFLLFLSLNGLYQNFSLKKSAIFLGLVFIVLISFLFSGNIEKHLVRSLKHASQVDFLPETIDDRSLPDKSIVTFYGDKQPVILSWFDSYINYRYGLKQEGFYSPILSHYFVDETADFLTSETEKGKKVIFWEQKMAKGVGQLNESAYMHSLGKRFSYDDKGAFYELKLVEAPFSNEGEKYLEFSNKGLFFVYPEDWTLEDAKTSIKFQDQEKIFSLDIKVENFNINLTDEQYLLSDKASFGQLVNQGLAQIPNFEKAHVRIWRDGYKETMKFYLFKLDMVVELTVSPSDTPSIWQFEKLLRSLSLNQ